MSGAPKQEAEETPAQINPKYFLDRVKRFFEAWSATAVGKDDWRNTTSIVVVTGKVEGDEAKTKSERFHVWLFGLLFPEVVILFNKDPRTISVLARQKKLRYFSKVAAVPDVAHYVELDLVELPTLNMQNNLPCLDKLLAGTIKGAVGLSEVYFGTFLSISDVTLGQIAEIVKQYLRIPNTVVSDSIKDVISDYHNLNVKWISVDAEVVRMMLYHDSVALENEKKAASLASRLLREVLLARVVEILDKEEVESHRDIALRAESAVNESDRLAKWESKYGLQSGSIDMGKAVVQSGGQYDLQTSAECSTTPLHLGRGSIVVSVVARYNTYYGHIARTLLLDPTSEEKSLYTHTLNLFDHICSKVNAKMTFQGIYSSAMEFVQKDCPKYKDYLLKMMGHCLGLSLCETGFTISAAAADEPLKPGMVLTVSVGFENVPIADKKKPQQIRKVGVWVADTLEVTATGNPVFLSVCTRKISDIVYELEDSDSAKKTEDTTTAESASADGMSKGSASGQRGRKGSGGASSGGGSHHGSGGAGGSGGGHHHHGGSHHHHESGSAGRDNGSVGRRPQRRRGATVNAAEAERVLRYQRELRKRKLEELKVRFGEGKGLESSEGKKSVQKMVTLMSYRDPSEFPKGLRSGKIFIDVNRECIFVPIGGTHVPLHVSTIRSVTLQEEDSGVSAFRLSFQVPGSQTFTKASEESPLPDLGAQPKALFIKELIFKSKDPAIAATCKQLKELLKKVKTKELMSPNDLTNQPQPQLVLNRTPKREVLRNLMIRHNAGHSRRVVGTLEAHTNGLRYLAHRHDTVDILYKNIKHAFFQPAANDLIVLIHFQLHVPIQVSKKKVDQIQVFTEAGTLTDDLDSRRRVGYDPDEIAEEQRELEVKRRLNTEFKKFVEGVQEISGIDFEIPIRSLGFYGVPRNSSVFVTPTRQCLVALSEWPVFVMSIADIEIVSLERVMHGLKHFDIVFIPRDYNKTVTTVTTVPVESLDMLKNWMNEMELVWYEMKSNLNWPAILKMIKSDVVAFVEDGGFACFLGDEEDEKMANRERKKVAKESGEEISDEDSSEHVDEEDDDDEDDEEYKESESGSEEEEDSEADSDDESLDEEASGSESEEEEEEEEGLSWDELEKQAIQEDRKRGHKTDDEQEDEKRKRKRKRLN